MLRRLLVTTSTVLLLALLAALVRAPALGNPSPGDPATGSPRGASGLSVHAPATTEATTVKLKGQGPARATVVVSGGAAPASVKAGKKGYFAVRVPLDLGVSNKLVARVATASGVLRATATVRQLVTTGDSQVSGRVVDQDGAPVVGATVSSGPRSTTTVGDGSYTLTGLPKGSVVVRASAAGHLDSMALSAGGAADVVLQQLAAPITVTPDLGGEASGTGWSVDIPPGAVDEPTALSFTPLMFSGPLDAYGLPFVDISPSTTFAAPITVTFDPAVAGDDARVFGVDPATGAARLIPATTTADGLTIQLTRVQGEEFHTSDEVGVACTPYTNLTKAAALRLFYRGTLVPYIRAKIGDDAANVWSAYLAGGNPTFGRYEVQEQSALDEFKDDSAASLALDGVRAKVGLAIVKNGGPALGPPSSPTTVPLTTFGADLAKLDIEYIYTFTTPANIAGGVGNAPDVLNFEPDERKLDATVRLDPTVTAFGALKKVTAVINGKLIVHDSADFCPGNLGNWLQEALVTTQLSRLEKTQLSDGSGTYAAPLLDSATVDVTREVDVTKGYPDNDPDGDKWPDFEPWAGADYVLDNCPGIYNETQSDSDGDGLGDACDSPDDPGGGGGGGGGGPDGGDAPDNGPRDPGSGGSLGDPHLMTFDHTLYDFNAAGDYIAARDASGDFEVQFRFARNPDAYLPRSISYNRGVAARVGDSVIAFGDTRSTDAHAPMPATLDGTPLTVTTTPTSLPGGATVFLDPTRHDIGGTQRIVQWPDGTRLAVGPKASYAYANLTLSDARKADIRGLLGNANGDGADDLTARDGTVITDPADLDQVYGVLGPSWRVTGSASLFRRTLPDSVRLPIRPDAIPAIATLPASATTAAQTTCEAQGLVTGWGLEQCILDVAVTGDDAFADNTALVATQIGGTVNEALITAPAETTSTLTIDSTASGSLDRRFAVDEFRIQLQAGEAFRMDAGGTCPHPGTFAVALIAPSGRAIDRSTATGCGHFGVTDLKESGTYLVRVQDVGGYKGSYSFGVSGNALGLTCTANNVGPNDDDSSPELPLPFPVDFFGQTFGSVWVNTNGNVTFDGPMSTYIPDDLATETRPIVAAFWDDVDTRNPTAGQVRYGLGSVDGRQAFCVRWDAVAHYAQAADDTKRNTFRLYLVDRGDVSSGAFDIVFQYGSIQWNYRGAGVGYTNGTQAPGTYLEVPGSRTTTAFLDGTPSSLVAGSAGGGGPGVRIYQVR
ncbi:MAG TPA: nidogen-like domain-containing protein [Nocardioides sp.]|nr:nidogen-like domain-containing protein [Nocardioides sp.]